MIEDNSVKIKIAPDIHEIKVRGNKVHTDFAGGITYQAEGLQNYKAKYVKECFQAAIALSSKRHQIEWTMNEHLKLQGKIS